jgi:methionyl-tRNA formyltransferase
MTVARQLSPATGSLKSMRFAIATLDRNLGIFEALCLAGWTPLKLFAVPVRDPQLGHQQNTIALAEDRGAAIQLSRISQKDIADLGVLGCEVLVVAGYDWKIPEWNGLVRYAVNFHPAPLPLGRGPYPLPRAILERRPFWGVACHRVTGEFDAGEILAAEHFPLRADECHESLDLRLQIAGKRLAARVARDFEPLWRAAAPQENGSYWPKTAMRDRLLDFARPVADLLLHTRAYGRTGSVALVNGTWLIVKRAVGWEEAHALAAGTVIHVQGRSIVIAAADGYLALLESDIAPLHVAAQMAVAQVKA